MSKTLETIPKLAAEWHPTKNGDLSPSEVTLGSGKKRWWLSKECGHEWDAIVANRVKGASCPICNGKRVLRGFNDLATTHPELAAEWHPTKNYDLLPTDVVAGKNSLAWWQGKGCSHEWEASIHSRSSGGHGCPYCAGVRLLRGFNDLKTISPRISQEWHPTKNGNLEPSDVSGGSDKSAYWQCLNCLHEWKSPIGTRVRKNSGCPACASRQKNHDNEKRNFALTHPELALEWHPTKNGTLTPSDVSHGSKREVWWYNSNCGHEWSAVIQKRVNNERACPYCSNQRVMKGLNDLTTLFPEVSTEWHYAKNHPSQPQEVAGMSNKHYWWLCDAGHEWEASVSNRTKGGSQCPQCWAKSYVSKSESDVYDVVKNLTKDTKVKKSIRSIIKGELDIYVPEKRLAVEFNGLYWHSEAAGKDRNYHSKKSQECAEKGIHLIHVWEDDWRDRRDIVVRALAHRLSATERLNEPGVLLVPDESLTRRYGARTLSPEVITHAESAVFLEANHIQGKSNGTLHTGLRDKEGILRAVFVTKRVGNKGHEGEWRIERYATRGIVPGGFTKLMKYAEAQIREGNLGDLTTWVTFSDGALSDGSLYYKYGFTNDGYVSPDYHYVVKDERIHKFSYRLKRFRDDPNLKYEEGLSERELALLNNIPRIWDSGKTRWVKPVNLA